MKSIKKVLCFLITTVIALCFFCGCSPEPTQSGTLEDITIKTKPKTEYVLGDSFTIDGGVIELQFDDGTTKDLIFSADGVTVSEPDMSTVGTKNVTVEYQGFNASYMITVSNAAFTVTFDYNYTGAPAAVTQAVAENGNATRPADPSRSGHRFVGWFTEAVGGTAFEFSETAITADTHLYAHWQEVNVITFDYNYPDAPEAVKLDIDKGGKLAEALAPSATRDGYLFDGWHTSATQNSEYAFGSDIDGSFTLYAHWSETGDSTVYSVTFDYNYFAYADRTVKVVEGQKVLEPQAPAGEDRTFVAWFTQAEGGTEYDFGSAVTQNITLYARWQVEKYVVNFKYVIDGEETLLRSRKITPGAKASAGTAPVVAGYRFVSEWYTDAEFTIKFDFSQPVNDDYNLYVKPLKENKFEAEYTYIDDNKTGVGSSDNFSGLKLIFVDNGTAAASNGYWVSGLYYNTAFVEFVITSDKDISDAHLQLSLSAEWADMYISPTNQTFGDKDYYGFEISSAPALIGEDGKVQKNQQGYTLFDAERKRTFDYTPIAITGAISFSESMTDKRPFTNYTVTTQFALNKGVNVVRFTVTNNHAPYDGTMEASAPMLDCISVFTDASLTWNPLTENVADSSKLSDMRTGG